MSVKIIDRMMQLAMGIYIRQFREPNSRSPGNLKRPILPNNITSPPSRMKNIPVAMSHLPICCGPKSISFHLFENYHYSL